VISTSDFTSNDDATEESNVAVFLSVAVKIRGRHKEIFKNVYARSLFLRFEHSTGNRDA
jgi:hypothetical protein